MNEFGETPMIFIWPKDHEEGQSFPDEFWSTLGEVLDSNGFAWEMAG